MCPEANTAYIGFSFVDQVYDFFIKTSAEPVWKSRLHTRLLYGPVSISYSRSASDSFDKYLIKGR